jgi:hypothetical protein
MSLAPMALCGVAPGGHVLRPGESADASAGRAGLRRRLCGGVEDRHDVEIMPASLADALPLRERGDRGGTRQADILVTRERGGLAWRSLAAPPGR